MQNSSSSITLSPSIASQHTRPMSQTSFGNSLSPLSPLNSNSVQIHRRAKSGSNAFSSPGTTSNPPPPLSDSHISSQPIPLQRRTSRSGEQSIQYGGVLLPSSLITLQLQTRVISNSLDNSISPKTRRWRSFDSEQNRWRDEVNELAHEHEPRVRMEWTEAEDRRFLQGLKKYGVRFDLIAAELPRRTKDQVRQHYKYFASSIKQNRNNAGYKRRLKVRGRPPRGRVIEPSKLYQELTAFIEYLENNNGVPPPLESSDDLSNIPSPNVSSEFRSPSSTGSLELGNAESSSSSMEWTEISMSTESVNDNASEFSSHQQPQLYHCRISNANKEQLAQEVLTERTTSSQQQHTHLHLPSPSLSPSLSPLPSPSATSKQHNQCGLKTILNEANIFEPVNEDDFRWFNNQKKELT